MSLAIFDFLPRHKCLCLLQLQRTAYSHLKNQVVYMVPICSGFSPCWKVRVIPMWFFFFVCEPHKLLKVDVQNEGQTGWTAAASWGNMNGLDGRGFVWSWCLMLLLNKGVILTQADTGWVTRWHGMGSDLLEGHKEWISLSFKFWPEA